MRKLFRRSKFRFVDFYILIPYVTLCILGILMVYSTSSYQLLENNLVASDKAVRQTIYFLFSLCCLIFVYRINLNLLRNKKMLLFLLLVMLLLLLALPFVGTSIGGAKRWLNLKFILFQPSELVPFILILYLAAALSKNDQLVPFTVKSYKGPLLVVLFFVMLVALEPNIAGASMILILVVSLLLFSGISPLYALATIAGFAGIKRLGTFLILSIPKDWMPQKFSYLATRFEVMLNPFIDPAGKGFQTSNAYYAMYNGGFWGLGLGKGIQKRGYLPAADTDYIFAVCIEELGLIVSLGILFLVFFLVGHLILLGIRSKNLYYSYLYMGSGILLLLQVSVNVGSLLGYIPMTGLTFPFISYGGSSMLILSIALGIALNARGCEIRAAVQEVEKNEHANKK